MANNLASEIRTFIDILHEQNINALHLPFGVRQFTVGNSLYSVVGWSRRAFIVVEINGIGMPFYLSSGEGGKANVPSGKWYPFFGVGPDGWLNKGSEDIIAKYYGSDTLLNISKKLDSIIGDIRNKISILPPANYAIIAEVANHDTNPVAHGNPAAAWNNINNTLVKIKASPLLRPYIDGQTWLLKTQKINEKTYIDVVNKLIEGFPNKKHKIIAYVYAETGISLGQDKFSAADDVFETWSKKYKKSINCSNPKGFSQRAHCAARKKRRAGGKTKSKPVREHHALSDVLLENLVARLCQKGWSLGDVQYFIESRLSDRQLLDENLRQWFKQKWVRFGPNGKIRGACARGSKSEGKPKCLPQAKAHALGKKGRASAAARKRRQDPNPNRRGKAKNVATKKKANESLTATSTQIELPKITKAVRNGYKLELYYDGSVVDLRVWPPEYKDDYNMNHIAYAVLDRDGNKLFPVDLAVLDDDRKGRGIAKIMYDYLKELGFTVYRGRDQTRQGKNFWDKNRGEDYKIWENISKEMIHKLADSKGIAWDNEPSFLSMTKKLTGKAHLDDLNQSQLRTVYQHIKSHK